MNASSTAPPWNTRSPVFSREGARVPVVAPVGREYSTYRMRKSGKLFLIAILVGSVSLVAGEETRKFTGHYRWDAQDLSGNLEAVFTPTGEATWDVAFHFNFQGPHTFVGTAEGSLTAGKLEGTVVNERETRKFSFRGTIRKDKFRGVHFESTGGARRKTGTLSMKAAD